VSTPFLKVVMGLGTIKWYSCRVWILYHIIESSIFTW